MSALDSLLSGTHFERVADVMALKNPYKNGALFGVSARQCDDLAEFPIGAKNGDGTLKYTPGGVALTGANLMAAVANAYAAAVAAGGGTVLIPAGHWQLNLGDGMAVTSVGYPGNVKIRGCGMDHTFLELPDGYAGTLFKFSGEVFPGNFYTNGGISDLSINCVSQSPTNTGTAIHIEATINMQFRNVTLRNFRGGVGLKGRKVGADGTNQYLQLWNFTSASNKRNFDWQSVVNGQGYGVYANDGSERDFICDDVKFSIYGGNIQSSAPILVELAGEGGCRLALFDFYYEGFSPLLFKLNAPSVTFNTLDIHGWHMGGNPAMFVDVDAFNNVSLINIYSASNAGTILKVRNGSACLLVNAGSPIDQPSKFDLDAAAAANLTAISYGGTAYFGGKIHGAIGLELAGYATGAEPSSPTQGRILRDTTHDRPSYKAASGFKRAAFTLDDFDDLSALLAPYCTEIFDPSVARLRSVISGANAGLQSLTGLIGGTVMAAPAAGQRPTWNIRDGYFGDKPTFDCAFTGNRFLEGTLANTIPVGSRIGMLVVFRALVAGADANRRMPAYLTSTSKLVGCFCGIGDLNDATHQYAYYFSGTGTANLVGPAALDTHGHVALITADPLSSYYLDGNAVVAGADNGLTNEIVNTLHIGSAWNTLAFVGCDVGVAYVAVLKQTLPPDVKSLANRLAMSKFGLR